MFLIDACRGMCIMKDPRPPSTEETCEPQNEGGTWKEMPAADGVVEPDVQAGGSNLRRKRGSVKMGPGIHRLDQPGMEDVCVMTAMGEPVPATSPSSPARVPEQTPETPNGHRALHKCFLSKPAATFAGPAEVLAAISKRNIFAATSSFEFCVIGNTVVNGRTVRIDNDFAEKHLEVSSSSGGDHEAVRARMAELGMAMNCQKGRKPEQPNQDNYFLCHTGPLTLCGVADGHGRDGHWVSHWAVRAALYLLLQEVEALGGTAPGQEVLPHIFELTHQVVLKAEARDGFDTMLSGSTLTVCIVDREAGAVLCGWAGDSRATVGTAAGKSEMLAKDHKPQDAEEKARIVASGGEVVRLEGDVPHRVFKKGGDIPGLAMSRAVGDGAGHAVGVIHKPSVRRCALQPGGFVICASDGVWEFVKNPEAVRMVHLGGKAEVVGSCGRLVGEARSRWLAEDASLTDDITGIVVYN